MPRIGLSPCVLDAFGTPKVAIAEYTLTNAVINDILSGVPATMKIFEGTPLEFEIPIRAPLESALRTNVKPKARITFMATGTCDAFDDIQIEQVGDVQVTGVSKASATVANVGVEASLRPVVYPLPIGTVGCQGGDGKQKTRDYYVDWYYDVTINPGVGFSGLADEYSQYVVAPCCTDVGGGWFDDDETGVHPGEEQPGGSSGGGWFG